MTITDIRNGNSLTVALEGRLETLTAPDLDEHLQKVYPSIDELIFDMAKLEYISSAGLRVMLRAQKAMQDKGGILIRHANQLVRGVFKVTGFEDFLRFED